MGLSPLERLIKLDDQSSSESRRVVLREMTDLFMAAPDRYGHRDMELFDLLLSRTAAAMDQRMRRLLAMALVRAGARDEHVKLILKGIPSPNERFLRRSVTQTKRDLFAFLIENAEDADIPGDDSLSDGNGLMLPAHMAGWMFQYQSTRYRQALGPKIGADRADVLLRTANKFRDEVVTASCESARDEVVTARRTVREWTRSQAITDDLLAELLEARAMTEFVFALVSLFQMDVATVVRLLNDTKFETLAIAARANEMRRSVFAKTVLGFRFRKTDQENAERVLALYDRIPHEAAERTVRFWRVRATDAAGEPDLSAQDAVA